MGEDVRTLSLVVVIEKCPLLYRLGVPGGAARVAGVGSGVSCDVSLSGVARADKQPAQCQIDIYQMMQNYLYPVKIK